jgi:hypothetical protein
MAIAADRKQDSNLAYAAHLLTQFMVAGGWVLEASDGRLENPNLKKN